MGFSEFLGAFSALGVALRGSEQMHECQLVLQSDVFVLRWLVVVVAAQRSQLQHAHHLRLQIYTDHHQNDLGQHFDNFQTVFAMAVLRDAQEPTKPVQTSASPRSQSCDLDCEHAARVLTNSLLVWKRS